MTTFKNNSKYAELVFTYLELAEREDTPITYQDVLGAFAWRFKGGSLFAASQGTRLKPATSGDLYPEGFSWDLSESWPSGQQCAALRAIVRNRLMAGRLRSRAVLSRLGTFLALTTTHGRKLWGLRIYSGMASIYHIFGLVWDWALKASAGSEFELLGEYTFELLMAVAAPSKVHLPTAEEGRRAYWENLKTTRVPGLLTAVLQAKELIRMASSRQVQKNARVMGMEDKVRWETHVGNPKDLGVKGVTVSIRGVPLVLGPVMMLVYQECAILGGGETRFALGKSDMERLHQLLMSAASAIVGVCAQAVVGTPRQRSQATQAVGVAQANISRIAKSARLVPLGDEVLVCKGYRRAYTAHLGMLAGPLCMEETRVLRAEAESTAQQGVLDVQGMLQDLGTLDAANSLNAAKMFKICPAPDVSPGLAMMDRIKQIGDSNQVSLEMMPRFKEELRSQILRAYIRTKRRRLELRSPREAPWWHSLYLKGQFDKVPSAEIHQYLKWEGTATMPDVSPYDPKNWKDSGLGADTKREASSFQHRGHKNNMITRLIFDSECPMPGRECLSSEHVIKFFIKAEGHKDPARGIFSANLTDRQAQSWMERAVEEVATHHPSFMIGQEADVKDTKIAELTSRPERVGWVALFYSFDISGWSAKMPAEPQRISHELWAELYGGHLFTRAREINEGSHIYLNLEGYVGWFTNTHANLEGFNGKEMTMVLIALLSLSVSRWREAVVSKGVMSVEAAQTTSALLFAYIDDGLSRIDLPKGVAAEAFLIYKATVIETFSLCGFSVEVSKCFPSDRFAIFLNEVYIAGRHIVHGVRAAMGISAEPTERHTSLIERCTSVATGVRGAVMAGLNPASGSFLMAYHILLHLLEWVTQRDPVVLATWSVCPRAWGGLGLPNMLQLFVSGSGSAFEEGAATLQAFARISPFARKVFIGLCKTKLSDRSCVGILTAPLSGRMAEGYMVDNRVAGAVRVALRELMAEGKLSSYAQRLLKYADTAGFLEYAESVVPFGEKEVLQEQMLDNVADAHPHSIFAAFARRLEKSVTVRAVVGRTLFVGIMNDNRREARESVEVLLQRGMY